MSLPDEQIEKDRREFQVLAARFGVHAASDAARNRYLSWRARDGEAILLFDRALLAFVRGGRFTAWLASSYAGRFARRSHLRRREVALLAFLECELDSASTIDTSRAGGPVGAWLSFIAWGIGEVAGLLLSLPIFVPLQIIGGRA